MSFCFRISQRRRRQAHRNWNEARQRSLGIKKGTIFSRYQIRLALARKARRRKEEAELKKVAEKRRQTIQDYEAMRAILNDPLALK